MNTVMPAPRVINKMMYVTSCHGSHVVFGSVAAEILVMLGACILGFEKVGFELYSKMRSL